MFLFLNQIAKGDIFEINATPYSPFSAEKSTKNLGYLGRGYDVLFGNPLDESGRVDPGNIYLLLLLIFFSFFEL